MSTCRAVVALGGTIFHCDQQAPHPGIAHSHTSPTGLDTGPVYWCSDGEARKHPPQKAAQ